MNQKKQYELYIKVATNTYVGDEQKVRDFL